MVGAVLVGGELVGGERQEFFGCEMPQTLAFTWRGGFSWQVIWQAEFFVVLLACSSWRDAVHERDRASLLSTATRPVCH